MTTTKKSVIVALSMLMTGVGFAETITWTGEGLDHLWSTKENWDKGRIPANGDVVSITKPLDSVAITNDIEGLSLDYIVLSSDAENQRVLTLVGKPLTLTTTLYAIQGNGTAVVTNAVEMTATSCQHMRLNNVVMLAPLHLQPASVQFYDSTTARSSGGVFYGAVDAPDTIIRLSSDSVKFYGPFSVKRIETAESYPLSCYFYGQAERSGEIEVARYMDCRMYSANTLGPNVVLSFNATNHNNTLNHYIYGNQTIDRVISAATTYAGRNVVKQMNGGTSVLTMRGSDNAWASVVFEGGMSLVWDPAGDFTQTFADQASTCSGTIDVRRGTLESSGNNTFKSVGKLVVAKNAAFKISASEANAAVNPFKAGIAAEIGSGGVIDVAENVAVTVASMIYAGLPVKAGTYTKGPDAPWLAGDGSVIVTASAGTGWKAAVSGNWSDAANWTDGVPASDKPAYLTLETETPYVVSLDADATLPYALTLGGTAATLKIPAGVSKTMNCNSSPLAYFIKDGAILKVDGGELVITNFQGSFEISGTGVETGKLAVVAGLFRIAPRGTGTIQPMKIKTGGAVEITGGVFNTQRNRAEDYVRDSCVVKQEGGTLTVSGTGRYDMKGQVHPWTTFGTGFSSLSGNAVITNRNGHLLVKPSASGETAELVVKDKANYAGSSGGYLRAGGCAGGTAKVLFDANVDFGPAARNAGGSALCILVGDGHGTALVEQRQGYLSAGQMGVSIGGTCEYKEETAGCEGTYVLKGGTLEAWGTDNQGWGQLYGPMGLAVGCGYYTKTTEGRAYHGVLRIEGGTVDSYSGYTTVGGGYGRGEVVQTGGTFQAQRAYMAIGYGHGVGRYVISNGTATVSCPLYIGGADLSLCRYNDQFTVARCPWINLHDAEGTLSVAGGTFTATAKDTTLGVDGAGTIEMDGSKGQLTLKNVIFTHRDDNAASGGTLRFKLDADGVSPIKATSVTFDEKAKIEVDLGGYEGRSLKLVESASVTGFDPDMVTITGARVKDATVKVTPTGIRLGLAQGMMLLFR